LTLTTTLLRGVRRHSNATDGVLRTAALPATTLTGWCCATLTLRGLLLISAEPDRQGPRKHEDCCDYESNSTHLLTWKKLKRQHFT